MRKIFDCKTCRDRASDEFRSDHGCPDPDVPKVEIDPEWEGTPIGRSKVMTRTCPGALLRYPGRHWHVGINGEHPAELARRIAFQRLAETEDAPGPMVRLAMAYADAQEAAALRDKAATT